MKRKTTYADAVSSIRNMVLCNDITKLDDGVFIENVCEATDEGDYSMDVYQYFITDCSYSDVDYLRRRYELRFAWCEKLSVWVLLVTHFGTMWSGVEWPDHSDDEEDIEEDSND